MSAYRLRLRERDRPPVRALRRPRLLALRPPLLRLLLPRPPELDPERLPLVRPSCRRRLFTVRAAISLARPEPRSESLMCSYIRSSLALQLFGIALPPVPPTLIRGHL